MFIPDDQIRNQHKNKSFRCISNLCKEIPLLNFLKRYMKMIIYSILYTYICTKGDEKVRGMALYNSCR